MKKSKIILVARYKIMLAEGCLAFGKKQNNNQKKYHQNTTPKNEQPKHHTLVSDSWINSDQLEFLFLVLK